MLKSLEISDSRSCWNKAREHEQLFVLLHRDEAAPATIRFWCKERVRLGLNAPDDPQIVEAIECALMMEKRWAVDLVGKGNQRSVQGG